MNIAFAGLRHAHILALYDAARKHGGIDVIGAWEEDEKARNDARTVVDVPFFDSYEALLNDGRVDAVAIGDYYGVRGERILRALKSGKNVIVDKPMCVSVGELDAIRRESLGRRLHVMCMLDLRYDPAVRKAREIVSSGAIGRVHAMNFTGQHPLDLKVRPRWYFEKGKHGGTINDIAIHGIDALRFITGLEFKKTVAARCWNAFAHNAPDFRDCAQFLAEFEGGAGLAADVSYAAPDGYGYELPSYWRFNIWGEDGAIEFKLGKRDLLLTLRGKKSETVSCPDVDDSLLADFMKPFDRAKQEDVFMSQEAVLVIQAEADRRL